MSRQKDIEALIARNQRRLQKLKEKQASYGLDTPVHILTEIEDIEAELERLQLELTQLEKDTRSSRTENSIKIKQTEPISQQVPKPTKQEKPVRGSLKIFISYRRGDSADVTGRIYDRLIQHYGQASIIKDIASIPLGVDLGEYVDRMVGTCDVLIAIIGSGWLEATDSEGKRRLDNSRDFVRIQLESALNRGIPVIPVLVQNATIPSEEVLPVGLRNLTRHNAISVRPDPDFHRDINRLIAGLDTLLKR